MILSYIYTVRKLILFSIFITGIAILTIFNNSKTKLDYDKSSGKIEYFEKEFQDFPVRDIMNYRYLKIDNYPYTFEIYEPNSEKSEKVINDLKVGDVIDIYYYEISDTRSTGINRFTQFIDKDGKPYFIRNGFQKQLGFVVMGLGVLINLMAFIFWKTGKIKW